MLANVLAIELEHTELPDDAAVFAALERDDSPIVGGVMREPWISKARAAGMTVAATGLDVPLADLELLVVREPTLASDPALVEAVVTSYYELQLERAKLIDYATTDHGLDRATAEHTLARLCLFDGPGAAAWFEDDAAMLRAAAGESIRVEPRFTLAASGAGEGAAAGLEQCLAALVNATRPQALGNLALPRDTALFEPGAALLRESAKPMAVELASKLDTFNPGTVTAEVIGFGDGTGAKARKLGRARADAIVEALAAAGVRMRMVASGKAQRDAPESRLEIRLSRAL
jgi:outer membrane protein OmpA-like peptidoglycan-associated protein